jgi:hypothetical protein
MKKMEAVIIARIRAVTVLDLVLIALHVSLLVVQGL